MNRTPVSPWIGRIFILLVAVLAVTGMLQMPLAKRYYVTMVPGLGWTGDYYLTHVLHYIAAIGLMALSGYLAGRWFSGWRNRFRLSRSGIVRVAIVTALILTGAARMYKNLPDAAFGPLETMLLDLGHLGLAGALAIAALAARFSGSRAYATYRAKRLNRR